VLSNAATAPHDSLAIQYPGGPGIAGELRRRATVDRCSLRVPIRRHRSRFYQVGNDVRHSGALKTFLAILSDWHPLDGLHFWLNVILKMLTKPDTMVPASDTHLEEETAFVNSLINHYALVLHFLFLLQKSNHA
jgi:hypothetical protein